MATALHRLERAKDPKCSRVHGEQTCARRDGDARYALAVKQPIWRVYDRVYNRFDWHDHLLTSGVKPVAPYNAKNTDKPEDIRYKVEHRIEKYSEHVHLKKSTPDKTYSRLSGVEQTKESGKRCSLGRTA